ncbi:MAG TPA: DNA polymerase III subunit delta' [Mycobacteriales bacterium]|nr:DNA polymerase III subunit delta' [Mycobacteriales bacterium]
MSPERAFHAVVGQAAVVEELRAAVAAARANLRGEPERGMSHAWLFTGPPGSGRSVAARAFATALLCPDGGCTVCPDCRSASAGTHPDLESVAPEGLSYGVRDARALVLRAALAPSAGRWRVTVVEDADRLTEPALNALLKAIEEPPAHGVFLLCAPSVEDVLPTVRSRCRLVTLRVPPPESIASLLVSRDGVDPALAAFAAHAAVGHVGRARRLATDEEARRRRREVLAVPRQVMSGVGACFVAAENLVGAAKDESVALTSAAAAAESAELEQALGGAVVGEGSSGGRRPRGSAAAFRELEERQRSRLTRAQRDALDRALGDLASYYRDVLAVQLGGGQSPVPLANADLSGAIGEDADRGSPEASLRRWEAVLRCRDAIAANVAPLLAVEAMTLELSAG